MAAVKTKTAPPADKQVGEKSQAPRPLDERIRDARCCMASDLRKLRNGYRPVDPVTGKQAALSGMARFVIRSAHTQMHLALADAIRLDETAESQGETEPPFVDSLYFTKPAALKCLQAQAISDYNKMKRAMAAEEASPGFTGVYTETMREDVSCRIVRLMQDGWSPAQVLQFTSSAIKALADIGCTSFFNQINDLLNPSNRAGRGFGGWLRRLWLPLALWDCKTKRGGPDVEEIRRRYRQAADLLPGLPPVDTEERISQFTRAVNNAVRAKEVAPVLEN